MLGGARRGVGAECGGVELNPADGPSLRGWSGGWEAFSRGRVAAVSSNSATSPPSAEFVRVVVLEVIGVAFHVDQGDPPIHVRVQTADEVDKRFVILGISLTSDEVD